MFTLQSLNNISFDQKCVYIYEPRVYIVNPFKIHKHYLYIKSDYLNYLQFIVCFVFIYLNHKM